MHIRFIPIAILAGLACTPAVAQQATPSAPPGAGGTPASPAATTTGQPAAKRPARKPSAPAAARPAAAKTAPGASSAVPAKATGSPLPSAQSAAGTAPAPAPAAEVKAAPDTPAASGAPQSAAEIQRLRGTTLSLIRLLVEQGILTREKADELLRAAEAAGGTPAVTSAGERSPAGAVAADAPAGEAAAPPVTEPTSTRARRRSQTVRVPYIPETVKNEIRDQVREDVLAQAKAERWGDPGAVPGWLDRISLDGDLRFRYQSNMYADSNTPTLQYNAATGANVSNTVNDETRYTVRARLGVNAKVAEAVSARMSFTSGNGLNPISLNQNLANSFSGYGTQIDQAFLRFTPSTWGTAWLGRMPKPFVSTELMFWEDINMDGAAGTLRSAPADRSNVFLTGGAFLIQKSPSQPTTPNPRTKSLIAMQLGGSYDLATATKVSAALGYYDYQNIEGVPNPTLNSREFDWTAPQFRQKGNTVFNIDNDGDPTTNTFALASKFRIVDLNASLDLAQFDPYVLRISGNYLENVGFNREEIRSRTGLNIDPRTTGYQGTVFFGKTQIKERHDWHVFVIYRRLQRDAVVDAFNDPDFNLGGTNHKGYQIGLRYGLANDLWVRARWTSADQIDSTALPGASTPVRFGADVLQVDLNSRF